MHRHSSALLAALAGVMGLSASPVMLIERAPMNTYTTHSAPAPSWNGTWPAKRATTAAALKRAARKRRHVRARASKRRVRS